MTTEHDAAEEFGEYLVYERLGVGGMATVHRAKKRGIAGYERGVALKRLLPHLAEDQEFIKSFVREAKLASMLVHPNIAQIYEFNRVGSTYYIAMEHVDGIDVRKILRYAHRSGEVVPLPVVLSILAELCDALEYAHTYCDELGEHVGIVHRDVSPSNLIVSSNGHLKVIDFGIAKATRPSHNTEGGRIKGKVGYLSPEAVAGNNAGPPSDMFSVGVVAFELLTTRPLFWAKTDFETLTKIKELEVPPPSSINPAVPPDLDRLVLQALERKVADRMQSAGDLRVGIDRIAQRYGYRLSSREVFDWLSGGAGIESWATIRPAPRSLSQQQAAASASQLRPLPLPPPPEPERERERRTTNGGRATSIVQAAALVEQGHSVGTSELSPAPRNVEIDLVAELAWGVDGQSYPLMAGLGGGSGLGGVSSASGLSGIGGHGLGGANGTRSSSTSKLKLPATRVGVPRWGLPVGLAVVLAGLAGFLLLRSPGAAPTDVSVITFSVQPSDSVIAIGGQPPNPAGTRVVRLAAPGVYTVSIHHAGYESWTETLTVKDANPMAIGVTLKPMRDDATTKRLDANPPADGDPAKASRGSAPAPGLAPMERERPSDGAAPLRQGPSARSAAARELPVDAGAAVTPDAAREAAREPSRHAGLEPLEPSPYVDAAPVPTSLPVDAGAAPPIVPMVSAAKVTKLSGSIPELHVRSGANTPSDVVAKTCIDERGDVTKVEVLRASAEIAKQVARELRTWKYRPYLTQDRKPSPACFPVSMRLIIVPS